MQKTSLLFPPQRGEQGAGLYLIIMISNLLDRMKLPFRKNKEFLTVLYEILGFYPHNMELYRIAFSHKSINYNTYSKEKKPGCKPAKSRPDYTARPLNNERLEFLGDAVIETVVSDILFRHFQHKREGFLTSTRSKIVQRETLNRLATEMGLSRLIHAAQGTDTAHTNIGGNAFEALLGAIYLDRGYKHCHWFISNRIVGHYIDIDNVAKKEVNFKSKLLEWSQKNRISINFRDFSRKSEGKGFGTVLTIEGITVSRGDGRSKKESQQEAAKEALTRMRRDEKFYDSLFRAKEKRTAMEAEESFALPKIDEIEEEIANPTTRKKRNKAKPPVLETRKTPSSEELSEEAYDAAYDENASYEVIDTPPEETKLTAADYAAKGLPAPPDADDMEDDEDKMLHALQRIRKHAPDAPAQTKADAKEPEERKAKKEKAERPPKQQKQESKQKETRKMDSEKPATEEAPASETQTQPDEKNGFSNGFLIVEDIHEIAHNHEESGESEKLKAEEPKKTSPAASAKTSVKEEPVDKTEHPLPNAGEENAISSKEGEDDFEATSDKEETATEPHQEARLKERADLPQEEGHEEHDVPSLTDNSDFEIFEVDNLPDITGNDEPEENASSELEEETSTSEEEEETAFSEYPSVNEPSVRPQLRHISLDDFVFGIDPSENEPIDWEEQATEKKPAASKPQKTRRRKRKPATPTVEEDEQANSAKKSHGQGRKESDSSEKAENAGKKSSKPTPQRRRRRPASKGGEDAAK